MPDDREKLKTYQMGGFVVQSYLNETTTWRLFKHMQDKKIIGRTRPPRKGFLGMVNKLLWEKKFSFQGKRYVAQGGGEKIAIYEDLSAEDERDQAVAYRECASCGLSHPETDLQPTDQGFMCQPCFDVWFPPCSRCGERVQLPEGVDPDDGPFLCETCAEQKES
ncbi:MAG: hypothetical protein ACTSXZ_04080 [Alphaproteobacteria bacterium]